MSGTTDSDSCLGNNVQSDAPGIRFIWAFIFIGVNIYMCGITCLQLYRSRGLFAHYKSHRIKITTRLTSFFISLLCIALAVLDLDTWIFSECPPDGNSIYIVYNIIKTLTDCLLCIAACALGYNMMRSFYRVRNSHTVMSQSGGPNSPNFDSTNPYNNNNNNITNMNNPNSMNNLDINRQTSNNDDNYNNNNNNASDREDNNYNDETNNNNTNKNKNKKKRNRHKKNGSQSDSGMSNNNNNSNNNTYLPVPMEAQFGWPLLCSILTICGIISLIVAYLPFISFVQAVVIYVDIRQLITSLGCFYFAFCIYFLHTQGKISMSSNKFLRRIFYFLVIFGILFFLSTITLSYSTGDSWSLWTIQSVAYYQLQKSKTIYYWGRLGILLISWMAYWVILLSIIRQVYAKRSEHVFEAKRTLTNNSSVQMY